MREAEKLFGTALAERHSLPDHLLLPALDYVIDDRVESGVLMPNRAAALVRGFTDIYHVSSSLAPPWQGSCTCTRPSPCRHQAAVVIAASRQPERFVPLAPAPDVTASVWAEAVFRLLAMHPDALEPLKAALSDDSGAGGAARVHERAAAGPKASDRPVDLTALAEQVRQHGIYAEGRLAPQSPPSAARLGAAPGTQILRDPEGMGTGEVSLEAEAQVLAQRLRTVVADGPVVESEIPALELLLQAALDGLETPLDMAVRALLLSLDASPGPLAPYYAATGEGSGGPSPGSSESQPALPSALVSSDRPARAAIACLERALWAASVEGSPVDCSMDGTASSDRAHRAAALLVEWIRVHRPDSDEAVERFVDTHAVLPAITPWQVQAYLRRGQYPEAERLAIQAYVTATGLRQQALRELLLTMVRAGREGPRRWLLAAWEAHPVRRPGAPSDHAAKEKEEHEEQKETKAGVQPETVSEKDPDQILREILGAVPDQDHAATLSYAQGVLLQHRAYASLSRLAWDEGDLHHATRWALTEGRFRAGPDLCVALADAVLGREGSAPGRASGPVLPRVAAERTATVSRDAAGGQSLLALELLSAAFQREHDGRRREDIVQRARSLVRRESGLGLSWATLRRRYFQELPNADRSSLS